MDLDAVPAVAVEQRDGEALPSCGEPPMSPVSPQALHRVDENAVLTVPEVALDYRSGLWEEVGPRSSLEDTHCAVDALDLPDQIGAAYYAVFDGHGGRRAAEFARDRMLPHILDDENFPRDVSAALVGAFQRTDLAFRAEMPADHSGCTALVVLALGRRLLVANAGDCRAVLSRRGKCIPLSEDHKPCAEPERARIQAAKGTVCDGVMCGALSVSRSLGDWHLEVKSCVDGVVCGPLISTPEVMDIEIVAEDEFIVLACDGLWDRFSSDGAVQFARQKLKEHNDPQRCAKELVEEALRRDSNDNVTVVVVCLKPEPPPDRAPVRVPSESRLNIKRTLSKDALETLTRTLGLSESGGGSTTNLSTYCG